MKYDEPHRSDNVELSRKFTKKNFSLSLKSNSLIAEIARFRTAIYFSIITKCLINFHFLLPFQIILDHEFPTCPSRNCASPHLISTSDACGQLQSVAASYIYSTGHDISANSDVQVELMCVCVCVRERV